MNNESQALGLIFQHEEHLGVLVGGHGAKLACRTGAAVQPADAAAGGSSKRPIYAWRVCPCDDRADHPLVEQGMTGKDLAALTDAALQKAGVGSKLLRRQLLNRRDEALLEGEEGNDIDPIETQVIVPMPAPALCVDIRR